MDGCWTCVKLEWKSIKVWTRLRYVSASTSADLVLTVLRQTPKPRPGNKPLMHFASELFDTHPRFIQLKSLLISLFNGEVIDSICLNGLEHVISVSLSPTPAALTTASPETTTNLNLPKVHIRAYSTQLLPSGTRIPRVELTPMGPALDLVMRRHQDADTEMWKQAMKRPKVVKKDVESGLGKKRKNMEVDEMGDLRGRVHVGKQDLSKLVGKKMKGLKRGGEGEGEEGMEVDAEDDWVVVAGKKKRKI